jgi:nucleoside-diphosphate-sugar epimerase
MMNSVLHEDIETIAKDIAQGSIHLSGKTVLITGGAGFLGNYFILTIEYLNEHVLEKPCKIISVDNFITGVSYKIEEKKHFTAIKHDVTIPLQIKEKVDYIISAAGIASPRFYTKFKIETIDVGVMGTKNMLELAKEKKVKSILYFSSSEVYGDPDPRMVPMPETYFGNVSCTGPRANYDESKRLGETLCVNYYEVYDVPVKMVRPFNIYGPCMRLDDYRVIPNFLANAFQGKPIPVYGDGRNTRTFCYVTDAMIGFFKVLLSDWNGESFNVGNDKEEISMVDLAHVMAEIFDNKVEIKNMPGPSDAYAQADPKRRCPDLSKIKTKCGYFPVVDLRTGLKRFIRWAVEEHHIKSPLLAVLRQQNIIR